MLRRFAGTFGFISVFLAIVSSEYITRMKKISGLPFLRAHHNLARIGIVLILLHPLTFVLEGRGFAIFSPISQSSNFISLAGRPALYMFLLAAGISKLDKNTLSELFGFLISYNTCLEARYRFWLRYNEVAANWYGNNCIRYIHTEKICKKK